MYSLVEWVDYYLRIPYISLNNLVIQSRINYLIWLGLNSKFRRFNLDDVHYSKIIAKMGYFSKVNDFRWFCKLSNNN